MLKTSVSCKLLRARTEDGLWLQGLAFGPERSDVGLLHIHGLAGNFYENEFIDAEAEGLSAIGMTMFSVSTRGRDYESDFLKESSQGLVEVRYGSAHEILDESEIDIRCWLVAMESFGIKKVVIQGHSLGTLKVARYISESNDERIVGCVLLSPADMHGMRIERLGLEKWLKFFDIARGMVAKGQGSDYMPSGVSFCPITADAFLRNFDNPEWNIYPFYKDGALTYSEYDTLHRVKVPALAIYGTVDEAVVGNDVNQALSILSKEWGGYMKTCTIEGSGHIYVGFEKELANQVTSWLKEILPSVTTDI